MGHCATLVHMGQCAMRQCATMSGTSSHTYDTDMLHMYMSHVMTWLVYMCNVRISHCTYKWSTRHVWFSHRWVAHCFSHIRFRYLTHINESCHTYESVVPHINKVRDMCGWGISRDYEACHTCEWVVSHVWMSHIARMNVSCPTYECGRCFTCTRKV